MLDFATELVDLLLFIIYNGAVEAFHFLDGHQAVQAYLQAPAWLDAALSEVGLARLGDSGGSGSGVGVLGVDQIVLPI